MPQIPKHEQREYMLRKQHESDQEYIAKLEHHVEKRDEQINTLIEVCNRYKALCEQLQLQLDKCKAGILGIAQRDM